MSTTIKLIQTRPVEVWDRNVTSNLYAICERLGIEKVVYKPSEIGITRAEELIPHIKKSLQQISENYSELVLLQLQPEGSVVHLQWMLESYLCACNLYPDAEVRAE